MDEVTGQWYYARWLGGGCRLVPGDEANGDGGAKGVVFSEGKLKIPLHFSSEGWWEGPPESGLRLCRRERYLILHRRKGDKGQFSEICAANSKCRAACLCYMSPLQGRSLRPGKVDQSATLVPPVPVTRMIHEAEYVTEPQCIPQKPCIARDREAAEKDEAAEKEEPPVPAEKEPSSTQSETGSQDGLGSEDFWPEPEAEGLPEQPSTAANPEHLINTEELPETTSDERLVQHPQIGSYCLGVTSRGHSPGAKTNVILLGEPPILRRDPPSKEVIESLGTAPESDYPEGTSDAADVNLAIVSESEELESPRTPEAPQSPKFERVVAEVEDLRTTIHGLLAVPENAELPDVPCPMAPSKSDASLLHGGSVIFDGGYKKWPGQDNDIPQEVSILHRESAQLCEFPIEQLGSVVSGEANVTSLGEEEEPDEDPRRSGGAGIVRSHKVSGHLSTQ